MCISNLHFTRCCYNLSQDQTLRRTNLACTRPAINVHWNSPTIQVQIKRKNDKIWGNMKPNPIKQKLQAQHLASSKNSSI